MKTYWRQFREDPREETFAPFYEASKRLVYTVCRRVLRDEDDALDAFQGVYDRLLAAAKAPRESASGVVVDDDVEAFVLRMAVREADRVRKARQRRLGKEIAMNPLPDVSDPRRSAPQTVEEQLRRARIEALLSTLPDRYRLPILLHYFDGLTHDQVAQALGLSRATVRTQIYRALKKLEPLFRRAGLGEAGLVLGGIVAMAALMNPPAALGAGTVLAHAQAAFASTAGALAASSASSAAIGASGTTAASSSSVFSVLSSASSLWSSLTGILFMKLNTIVVGVACVAAIAALLLLLKPNRPASPANPAGAASITSGTSSEKTPDSSKPASDETASAASPTTQTLAQPPASISALPLAATDAPTTGPRMEFTGRILLAASHAPAAGATVEVLLQDRDPDRTYVAVSLLEPLRVVASTTADSRGYYRLALPDSERCHLAARRPGSASALLWYVKSNTRSIQDFDVAPGMVRQVRRDIVLQPASALAGRVVDDKGRPVAGARLVAFQDEHHGQEYFTHKTSAATDEAGRFHFDDVPLGGVTLAVAAPGFVPCESVFLAPERKATVRLSRSGASLAGRVFHAATGMPVSGLELYVQPDDRMGYLTGIASDSLRVFTTPQGEFRLELLPPGPCSLELPSRKMTFAPGQDDFTKNLVLKAGERIEDLALLVIETDSASTSMEETSQTPTRVSGRIVHPDALPLEDGILEVYRSLSGASGRPQAVLHPVGPDGRFDIEVASPCRLRLQARARGFAPTATDILDVAAAPLSDLRIQLAPACSIQGTVVDADGRPIPDVAVIIWDRVTIGSSWSSFERWSAVTDAAGAFALEGIPPGIVSLNLERDGYGYRQEEVALDAAQPVASIRFTLEKGHFLSGTVTDEEGNPVEDARVSANPAGKRTGAARNRVYRMFVAQTDAWGAFRIDDIPGGESYVLQASGTGGETVVNVEALDQENLALVLHTKERPVFRGTVVDHLTGEPIAAFQASVDTDGLTVHTDPDRPGVFRVRGMFSGQTTSLTLAAPGYATIHDVTLRAGGDNTETSRIFRMGPGVQFSGRAVDAESSEGLPETRVLLRSSDWIREKLRVLAETRTDQDGHFVFQNIATGEYSISVIPAAPRVEVKLRRSVGLEGDIDVGDIKVGGGCSFHGRVIHRPGEKGVAGVPLTLTSLGTPVKTITTDAEGRYEFSGLVNRPYAIHSPSQRFGFGLLNVDPNSRIEVDIVVGDTTLRGRFVSTIPLCDIHPSLAREDDPNEDLSVGYGVEMDEKGGFVVKNLAAGRYVIQAYIPRAGVPEYRETFDIPETGIVERTFAVPEK